MDTSDIEYVRTTVTATCAAELRALGFEAAGPSPGEVEIRPGNPGEVMVMFEVQLPFFALRFHATVDGGKKAEAVGRRAAAALDACFKMGSLTKFRLAEATDKARAVLSSVDEHGLRILGARPALVNLDYVRNDLRPELVLEGLGDDLLPCEITIDAGPYSDLATSIPKVVVRQALRQSHLALMQQPGVHGLTDEVTLEALKASDVHGVADLPRLGTASRTVINGSHRSAHPWRASILRRDGILRVRGAPDRQHIWECDHLALSRGIGRASAAALIGQPARSGPRHPWIKADALVMDVDAVAGRWLTYRNDLVSFDASGRVIATVQAPQITR